MQRRFCRVFVSALPLFRFRSPKRLAEFASEIEAMGGAVSNAHSSILDDAGWKRHDAPQDGFKMLADPMV